MDNEWEDDHFKSVVICENARLEVNIAHDDILDEDYITVMAPGLKTNCTNHNGLKGAFPGYNVGHKEDLKQERVQVVFIPYYYRGNRGGRGHMRVGFRSAM